jgi:hypothetical protein
MTDFDIYLTKIQNMRQCCDIVVEIRRGMYRLNDQVIVVRGPLDGNAVRPKLFVFVFCRHGKWSYTSQKHISRDNKRITDLLDSI